MNIDKIINSDFNTIKKDGELSLLLLKLYSELFLNGNRPSTCIQCMRDYHSKIIKFGKQKIKEMEDKTCKMKKGIVYVRQIHKHISDNNITDEEAVDLLEKKFLQERHFEILPKAYKAKNSDVLIDETIVLTEKNKGKFTETNLHKIKGNLLIQFAGGLTGIQPKSKKNAIEMIINWQDK